MFKIKQTKKSTKTLTQLNGENKGNAKRMELNQNNDFVNVHSHQYLPQSQQCLSMNQNNQLKNGFLRPRSGLSRNLHKVALIKYHELSDQQLIQEKMKQKAINKLLRPSTSTNLNDNNNNFVDKKQRLMNRKGTMNSSTHLPPKSMKIIGNENIDCQNLQYGRMVDNSNKGYVSNQQALQIITKILNRQEEYVSLRQINEQQFQRIREKLISDVSIIVLKWYKILQDRVYNQVRTNLTTNKINNNSNNNNNISNDNNNNNSSNNNNISNNNNNSNNNHHHHSEQTQERQDQRMTETIQQVISQQIKRYFIKCDGLFTLQQKCNSQQSRLQQLINGRLCQLQNLLTNSRNNK